MPARSWRPTPPPAERPGRFLPGAPRLQHDCGPGFPPGAAPCGAGPPPPVEDRADDMERRRPRRMRAAAGFGGSGRREGRSQPDLKRFGGPTRPSFQGLFENPVERRQWTKRHDRHARLVPEAGCCRLPPEGPDPARSGREELERPCNRPGVDGRDSPGPTDGRPMSVAVRTCPAMTRRDRRKGQAVPQGPAKRRKLLATCW